MRPSGLVTRRKRPREMKSTRAGQGAQNHTRTRIVPPFAGGSQSVPAIEAAYPFLAEPPFAGHWKVGALGCILWTGPALDNGYGRLYFEGRTQTAHRIAYVLGVGPILDASLFACHSCDVRLCVNPAHLFLGTHLDNMRDMVAKGRHPGSRSLIARGITAPTIPRGRSYPMRCYERAVALVDDPTLAAHGLLSTYRRFLCRCVACREANRCATRDYAAKRKPEPTR